MVEVPDDDVAMPCDCPGCGREATHSSSRWATAGHLRVDYWCAEHAPDGAEPFDEEDDLEEDVA